MGRNTKIFVCWRQFKLMKYWIISIISLLQQDNFLIQNNIRYSLLLICIVVMSNTEDTKEDNILGALFLKMWLHITFWAPVCPVLRRMKTTPYRKSRLWKIVKLFQHTNLYRLRSKFRTLNKVSSPFLSPTSILKSI